jgi:hypothetical protein
MVNLIIINVVYEFYTLIFLFAAEFGTWTIIGLV